MDPGIFGPEVMPVMDSHSKYAAVNSSWESSVPDMFFIGAAMANNDRKTTPGFIHGFRYNVRTVFHLIEQRYHSTPLPARIFPLENREELETLVQAMLTRVSTTSAMFQMFGVLIDAMVFSPGETKWYSELPAKYIMEQPEFAQAADLVTVSLELGFDRFPKGTDSLSFIHPNDPAGEGLCTAFLHPVLRHFREGTQVDELHLTAGVFVRYDAPNEEFAVEFDKDKPHHLFYNFINRVAGLTDEVLQARTFEDGESAAFSEWPSEKRYPAPELPACIRTRGMPDPEEMAMAGSGARSESR
jgi:hypothetical protein